jgi:hypothetical protein
MGMPKDIGIIDCMLGIPEAEDRSDWFTAFRPLIKDAQTLQQFSMPAQYMFKDVPQTGHADDYVQWTVEQMDKHGIDQGAGRLERERNLAPGQGALSRPLLLRPALRSQQRAWRKCAGSSGSMPRSDFPRSACFPAGTLPQVAINHKYMFPLYACAVELGIPILLNVGIPGPRIPMETQKVEHLDEVCWFFPDLKIVMRHGAEPWAGSGSQADAEMAKSLLLNQRLRAQALPQGDYRLRQHPWRRQGDLRWLLPDGPQSGADYGGHGKRAAEGRGLAQVSARKRRTRFQALTTHKNKHRIAGENTMTEAASDARTAPVAVWQVLEKMTKEEREAWRVADIPNRPTAEQRNLDIGFPFGWYPFELLADQLALGEVKPAALLRPRPGGVARRGRPGSDGRRLLQAPWRAHGPWRQGSRQLARMPVPRLAL